MLKCLRPYNILIALFWVCVFSFQVGSYVVRVHDEGVLIEQSSLEDTEESKKENEPKSEKDLYFLESAEQDYSHIYLLKQCATPLNHNCLICLGRDYSSSYFTPPDPLA